MLGKLKKKMHIMNIYLFGNTLSIYMNIKHIFYNISCRVAFFFKENDKKKLFKKNNIARNLKTNGVVIAGLDKNINKIKNRFDNFFNNNKKNYIDNNNGYFFLKRQLVSDFSQEIFYLLKHDLDSFLKNYYQSYYKVYWCNIVRSYPIDNHEDDESLLYHFDDNPKGILKIFIYINSQDDNNGAFRSLLKKDSTILKKRGFLSYTSKSRAENQKMITESNFKNKVKTYSGREGTILVFENNIIHKGNLPKKGYRDLIVLEIMQSHRDFLEKDVEKFLSKPIINDFPKNPFFNI
jgi:hypothetical protein